MSSHYQKILIITAPSGAGKTSITKKLMVRFPELAFSISAATRAPRGTEINCKDYYFMSETDFQEKIKNKEFAEWEMVYEGKYYGTLKSEMERIWAANKIPVLDIDVKGAIHVQKQYPVNTLSIFIQPPSIDVLKIRLEGRGTETADSLEARINKAAYEISFKSHFDEVILNDNLEHACERAEDLVGAFLKQPLQQGKRAD